MERRFPARLRELLDDAEVPLQMLEDMLPRLETFLNPFVQHLTTPGQQAKARHYVAGLVSDLDSKNVESIAYLHDQDRQGLQKFIGQAPWDHLLLQQTLVTQVADHLGQSDAVLVFDPSAFPKKGTKSVGVQRQWCGRLGKLDNCQVGVYLGYVSQFEHVLVDFRLYLPKEWTQEKSRRAEAGVPKSVRFRTRHELALEMLDSTGSQLPHGWISGDDEMGRSSRFRQALRDREEAYLLAVPSNTLIRDVHADEPPYSGRGRRPKVPFVRVDQWCAALPEDAWTKVEVRPGEKGPLVVEVVCCRVQAKTEQRRTGPEETLVVFRERQGDGSYKHDYTLSNQASDTELSQFAWVFQAQHRIEECLQRAKGEAGLADYEVRTWDGWHHHQMLSLLAVWFLTQETRRGKKLHPHVDGAPGSMGDRDAAPTGTGCLRTEPHLQDDESPFAASRNGSLVLLETT